MRYLITLELLPHENTLRSKGSGVYSADGGTSAACPVAAGVVAAIRSKYPPAVITPAQLRNLLRRSAKDLGSIGFDYDHGFGLIDVPGIIDLLEQTGTRELRVGETVSGRLNQAGDTAIHSLRAVKFDIQCVPHGDFDIYVKKGAAPTVTDYDYRGYTGSADEKIRIQPAQHGEYYVMIRSYRGSGEFSLRAVMEYT